MASGLQRLSSGDMLAALEGLGGGEASDFDLTKDEVTIAQIHNLSTGHQTRAMSDFGSSLLGGTDLPASLPADHGWHSPAASGGDSFAPRVPSSTSLATSDRGSRGSVGRASGVAARNDPALADSASSKPRAPTVPRVASLAKPAPKREPPPPSPGAAKPSAARARLDSLSAASSRTLSPRGSVAAPGSSSRPTVGARSPTPRSSTVSPASSGAPSPVPRTSSISGRIPSSPNTGRPTSPPGPAPVNSRGASSPNLGPRLSAADGGVAPRASSVTAARGSLSPSGPALGSRIPRPSVSAQASPDSRPSLPMPAGATSPGATGRASLGPTSPGRPSLLKGPSGKYVGAAGKAPARKALEDIMSELQEVKQQLGLPVTSRSSRAGSEVDEGLDEDDVLAATRAARLAASAAPATAAAPVVAMGVPVGLPVEPAPPAAAPPPEEAARIVLNISVSETAEAAAEGQQAGAQADAADAETAGQDSSAAAEAAAEGKQEDATAETSSGKEPAAAVAAAAPEAQAIDAAAEHETRVAAAALVARAFAAAIVRSEQEELLAAREAERAKQEADKQAATAEEVPADATADVTGVLSAAPAAKEEEEPAVPAAEEEKEQPAAPEKAQPEPLDLTGKENKPVNTCGCGCVIM